MQLSEGLPRILGDRVQLQQVILNLIMNAIEAMPDGGVLRFESSVRLDDAEIRIADTGCGIPPEVQDKIFRLYFTTKEKGSGIGLAMTYRIIQLHDGTIDLTSEPGKGTTFKIYLPRVEEAVQRDNRQPPVKSLKGSETILLVEDEESLRALTRSLLVQSGYTVLDTNNGARALEIARDYRRNIHLLLTDVVLPGIGGSVLAEEMGVQYPAMKVLFMSGYTDNAVAAQGVLEEGTFLLQKPFDPEALRNKVREVLDVASPKNLRAPVRFAPATERLENLLTVKKR